MKRKGISLVGFKTVESVREIAEAFPESFFELSYATNQQFLDEITPMIEGRVASVHSLCPRREFFPNFASRDRNAVEWSERELLKDAETANRYGASFLVLHPGYATDELVSTDPDIRIGMMEREFSKYVIEGTSSIAQLDYIRRPEYRDCFKRMTENIVKISEKIRHEGVTLAIENLNPRAGYMLLHPDEVIELSRYDEIHFTIDIGHLWITTELYNIDFLESLERILATGKVVTTHLHSNPSSHEKFIFEDRHQSVDRNSLPWEKAFEMIDSSGANMMLETVEDPHHNLELLLRR